MAIQRLIGLEWATPPNQTSLLGNYYGSNRYNVLATGIVTKFRNYFAANGNLKVAIHAENGSNHPGALIVANNTGFAGTVNNWSEGDLTPTLVTLNQDVWIGGNSDVYGGIRAANTGTLKYNPYTYSSWVAADPCQTLGSTGTYTAGFQVWGYVPPSIIDIDTDNSIVIGQTGITLNGANLLDSGGNAKLEICNNSVYGSATIKVEQTFNSQTDTTLNFDYADPSSQLAAGTYYAFVTSGLGQVSTALEITITSGGSYDPMTFSTNDYLTSSVNASFGSINEDDFSLNNSVVSQLNFNLDVINQATISTADSLVSAVNFSFASVNENLFSIEDSLISSFNIDIQSINENDFSISDSLVSSILFEANSINEVSINLPSSLISHVSFDFVEADGANTLTINAQSGLASSLNFDIQSVNENEFSINNSVISGLNFDVDSVNQISITPESKIKSSLNFDFEIFRPFNFSLIESLISSLNFDFEVSQSNGVTISPESKLTSSVNFEFGSIKELSISILSPLHSSLNFNFVNANAVQTTVYASQIEMVKRVIAQKGQRVIWQIVTSTFDEEKPWLVTGETVVPYSVDMVFFPVNRVTQKTIQAMTGTEVVIGYEVGLMGNVSFEPSKNDSILRGSKIMKVLDYYCLSPNGENIMYLIVFRR